MRLKVGVIMSFEAKEKAVDKLLNDAIYYIPRNQRRYVWNAQNWADMYDDVLLRRDLSRSVFAKQCAIRIDKQQKERYNNVVIDNDVII